MISAGADSFESIRNEFVIRPSFWWKVFLVFFAFGFSGLSVWFLMIRRAELTLAGQLLTGSTTLFFVVLGVDYFQRIYLFRPDEVKIRYLFIWKTYKLPSLIVVTESDLKETVLWNASSQTQILRVPRDYYRRGALPKQLQVFYKGCRRIFPDSASGKTRLSETDAP